MAFNKKLTLEGLQYYHSKLKSLLFNKVDKEEGKGLSTNDYTTLEKDKLNGISIGAEVNQNAFSNILIDSTTITANSKTDILKIIAGTDITLISDINENAITISSSNTTYSAGTGISLSGTTFSNSGVRSITTGSSNGTISVNTNGTTADVAVYGLGSAAYTDSSAYATASHTHSYLPLSGGTLTGSLTLNSTLSIKNQFYQRTLDGYTVASLVSTEATTNTDNETRLTLGSSAKNRPGKIQLYNHMGGSATFGLTDGGSKTYDLCLPCTSGILTTSAGKSATYTSSLSSGSDTLFTQAGAYAMYSELNSNLDSLLGITTNDFDCVANFSSVENADNAPQGIRKGQVVTGYPSRFGEWVMYQTYYYDVNHQYGWQLAFSMNGNGIAYRYRRNSTWNDWAYLVLES